MRQILSELVGICRRYDRKHFGVFFGSQCRMTCVSGTVKSLMTCSTTLTATTSVTDRQKDRQTDEQTDGQADGTPVA